MANWICLPFHLNKNTWVDASLLHQFRASPLGTSTLADLWSQGLEFQAIATLCFTCPICSSWIDNVEWWSSPPFSIFSFCFLCWKIETWSSVLEPDRLLWWSHCLSGTSGENTRHQYFLFIWWQKFKDQGNHSNIYRSHLSMPMPGLSSNFTKGTDLVVKGRYFKG